MAAMALRKVGIEVAMAGSADEEAAATPSEMGELGSSGTAAAESDGAAQAAAAADAVTPDALAEIWEQERQAWSVLLDGSGLSEHMEVGGGLGWAEAWREPACLAERFRLADPTAVDRRHWGFCPPPIPQPLYLENLQKYLEAMAAEGKGDAQQQQQQQQQSGEQPQGSGQQDAAAVQSPASQGQEPPS